VVAPPFDEAETLLGGPPILAVQTVGCVVGDPCDEVIKLVT
jgi:hypothetical protein